MSVRAFLDLQKPPIRLEMASFETGSRRDALSKLAV